MHDGQLLCTTPSSSHGAEGRATLTAEVCRMYTTEVFSFAGHIPVLGLAVSNVCPLCRVQAPLVACGNHSAEPDHNHLQQAPTLALPSLAGPFLLSAGSHHSNIEQQDDGPNCYSTFQLSHASSAARYRRERLNNICTEATFGLQGCASEPNPEQPFTLLQVSQGAHGSSEAEPGLGAG